jgi:16S rRNA C967 or C1407 C5-methylase (RsmB/RsmF family)/NOL1/NOP2/fmu family ribosome biogenesis protein
MTLPAELLRSLTGIKGFDKETFEAVHQSAEQLTSIRLNKAKSNPQSAIRNSKFKTVPWCTEGYYLPERPYFTHDPLLHAGVYYVQEASSMFLSFVMRYIKDSLPRNMRVLDLCAAPGGKSTLLLNEIGEDGLLLSNEVIKSRANILEENITKWGLPNVVITNNDPKHFSSIPAFFDVMVIDAPCSGSGLFRRDPDAIKEWSLPNVELCSQRQQRIIADAWDCLKQDGFLIYSTCSYSKEEDEAILDWLCEEFIVDSIQLTVNNDWGIVETVSEKHGAYGYRFYPDKLKGEGLFMACLRKKDGGASNHPKIKKPSLHRTSKAEDAILKTWISDEDAKLITLHHNKTIFAFPKQHEEALHVLSAHLFIRKAGIELGEAGVKEFIPHHSLAVSTIVNRQLPSIELNLEQAIQYLKKEELKLQTDQKGWCLVRYGNACMGWIKILPNRINNYYPKEWRVLK